MKKMEEMSGEELVRGIIGWGSARSDIHVTNDELRTELLRRLSELASLKAGEGWIPCIPDMKSTNWCHIVWNGIVQHMPACYDAADKQWIWLNGADPIPASRVSHYWPLPPAPAKPADRQPVSEKVTTHETLIDDLGAQEPGREIGDICTGEDMGDFDLRKWKSKPAEGSHD